MGQNQWAINIKPLVEITISDFNKILVGMTLTRSYIVLIFITMQIEFTINFIDLLDIINQ